MFFEKNCDLFNTEKSVAYKHILLIFACKYIFVVYLENTNLLYALCPSSVQIGTARETFAIAHLSKNHNVEYGKDNGDFKVDSKYHFEIGGRDKGFSQIADLPSSYVFADDIESPVGAKLPLWMLGFLY